MADEKETKTTKSPGLMTLIKAVAFVSIIVVLQIAAGSMLIPSAGETAEIAEKLSTANLEKEGEGEEESSEKKEENVLLARGDMVEVALGSYHVLSYNPENGSRTNVDFDLFATVLEDEEGEFFDLFTSNEHRIREQVQITLRGSDLTDLTDPTLGLVKRNILEKVNRALGKPLLHETVFSRYSFEER